MAMRHSIQERMSMTKETLKLKSKSTGDLIAPYIQAQAVGPIAAGRNSSTGKPRSCKGVTRLLEAAISNNVSVFIQLRHGAGYQGLPTMLDDGWLTLQDAEILGTKQNRCVAELLIQVKDGSYIAHIHTSERQDPLKDFDTAAGELK